VLPLLLLLGALGLADPELPRKVNAQTLGVTNRVDYS